jgi:GNAT superfamily N-acetyltransferase
MIKKITEKDRSCVIEIASKIWEGDDYISFVFDEWVNDTDGNFAGLWENGKLVGFGRLKFLTPTDIWLEGLRKDPDSNSKGVGEKLSQYYYNYLQGKKITSIRFSTYFDNIASIKLNEKLGFKKVLTLSLKSLDLSKTEKNISEKISSNIDFKSIKQFVENSSYLQKSKRFIGKGWVVYKYSEKLLRTFYDDGNIVVWLKDGLIKGSGIWAKVNYPDVFWISFLEADNYEIFISIKDYFNSVGRKMGKEHFEILIPDNKLKEFCNRSGFESWEQENDFMLYELPQELINRITSGRM